MTKSKATILLRLRAFWLTPRFSRIEFYGVCVFVMIMRHFT